MYSVSVANRLQISAVGQNSYNASHNYCAYGNRFQFSFTNSQIEEILFEEIYNDVLIFINLYIFYTDMITLMYPKLYFIQIRFRII